MYTPAVFLKSCKNIMLVCSLENVMSEMEMSVALLNRDHFLRFDLTFVYCFYKSTLCQVLLHRNLDHLFLWYW